MSKNLKFKVLFLIVFGIVIVFKDYVIVIG
jgi:hypothetical protein